MKYKAYLVHEDSGNFSGSISELDKPTLEDDSLIIKVSYSSLNYKDALASSGAKGVVRSYPFVPGIDVAGEVIETSSSDFLVGDSVIATGYKIGMSVHGGFGEIVQLPSKWVLKSPKEMSNLSAMSYGTAGITAAACVKKIVDANLTKDLPVIVSGATGGVGSIAVGILSKIGYEVHALTGKGNQKDKLISMGATQIISRSDFMKDPVKPLDRAIYCAAVDTVGGDILSKIISSVSNQGVISCCGNVAGPMFQSSVFPFILRGIQLCGIDSAESSLELKKELWDMLANEWSLDLSNQTKLVNISDIKDEIIKILDGNQVGRVVIKHGG